MGGIAVAGGAVPATVDDARDRLDAQVAIAVGDVTGHGRGRNIDVDAVVAVAAGEIADQQRPGRPAVDQDPVAEVAGHDVA